MILRKGFSRKSNEKLLQPKNAPPVHRRRTAACGRLTDAADHPLDPTAWQQTVDRQANFERPINFRQKADNKERETDMKKNLLLALFLLLFSLTFFAACQKGNGTTSDTTPAESTPSAVLATAYDHPEDFVHLPAWEEITVSDQAIQKEVDSYIQSVLDSLGREDYQPMDQNTTALLGDKVNIHYTGRAKSEDVTLSEEALAGMTNAGSEEGYDLVLGSGSFIPGFEEQLIGAKAGDTVTVDVTFPDDYGPSAELRGVAVLFEVTVNSLSRAVIGEENVVLVSVLYSLVDAEEKGEIADLLEEHEVELDFRDADALFDEYFAAAPVRDALLGLNTYGTASVTLTLSAEESAHFGYEDAVTLKAMLTVEQIVYYPEELTDEEVSRFTGGEYQSVDAFSRYIYDHYRNSLAYTAIADAATYEKMPDAVYEALFKSYYDAKIYNLVGDIEGKTEEELAVLLTEEIKKEAEEYAAENAAAEFQDRMLIAYLAQRLDFTLTDAQYDELLSEMYDYYVENYYMSLIYLGISSIEDLEEYFGSDNLRFQFTTDEIISRLGDKITVTD